MKKKLGEILVSSGAVTPADIMGALDDQTAGEPSRLGDLLLASGKITSAQLAQGLAEQYGLTYVDLPPLPQAVLELVPFELQRQFRFVPLRSEGAELSIAMSDLANLEVVATLEQTWAQVHVFVASGDEVDAVLASVAALLGEAPGVHLPSVAPAIAPRARTGSTASALFGDIDLESAEGAQEPRPSPVPLVAPLAPRPPAAAAAPSPRAEDLFGDLNLESARTGIGARSPEATVLSLAGLEPALAQTDPLVPVTEEPVPVVAGRELPDDVEDVAELEAEPLREGTGPVIEGFHEGTGPVLDVPFFRDLSVSDGPQPPPVAPARPASSPRLAAAAAPPAPTLEALPDWLSGGGPPVPGASAAGRTTSGWSGALDHLAPSKLAQGVARALLAKGVLTEQEILDALGSKQ